MSKTIQNTKRAAEFPLPSSAAIPESKKPPQKMDAEIRNLPGKNFIVTREILKNNVCRICATYYETGPNLVPLYLHHDSFRLSKVINTFLPIKVHKDDGLPEYACRSCTDVLLAWRDVRDNCKEAAKILTSQAELTHGTLSEETNYIPRNERSQLNETVQSVLATYLLNVDMELVCQECDLRTSSEDFVQHLESKHGDVRGHDAVEAFVKDHVTFEEVLMSDSDADVIPMVSPASTEPSRIPLRSDSPSCSSTFSNFHHLTPRPGGNLEKGFHCRVPRVKSKEHPNYNPLQCRLCNHVALDTAALSTHVALSHTLSELDISTNKRPASQFPDETNQKRIPAVCPECNRTFSNKYNMLNHMKSHSKVENLRFDCECGKSYTTRGNLVAHRRTHTGELPRACGECGARFRTRAAGAAHHCLHSGARPFPCPHAHCALAFRDTGSRDRHQQTHAPPQHECQLCGDKFRRKAHLRYHVGTHRRRPT